MHPVAVSYLFICVFSKFYHIVIFSFYTEIIPVRSRMWRAWSSDMAIFGDLTAISEENGIALQLIDK